jgi:hypothetical protein
MEMDDLEVIAPVLAASVFLTYFLGMMLYPFAFRRYSIKQDVSIFINKADVETQVWKWGRRLVHQETELVDKSKIDSTLNRQRYNAKERIKQLKKA